MWLITIYCILLISIVSMGFPRGSVVKNLPAVLETQVPFLGWEYPMEKEIATHSSVGTPVGRGAGELSPRGCKSQCNMYHLHPRIVSVLSCVFPFSFFLPLPFFPFHCYWRVAPKWVGLIYRSVSQTPTVITRSIFLLTPYPQYGYYWWRSQLWGTESQ